MFERSVRGGQISEEIKMEVIRVLLTVRRCLCLILMIALMLERSQ